MELVPLGIHGDSGLVFVLPHFAQQNISNPAAWADISHRLSLPRNPRMAPATAGLGLLFAGPPGDLAQYLPGFFCISNSRDRADPDPFGTQ